MSWNNAARTKQFETEQEKLIRAFRKNNMSEEAIQEMAAFDKEQFLQERNSGEHLDIIELDSPEDAGALEEMAPYYDRYDPFIVGFEDERLNRICELADEKDMRILRLLAEGYTQTEIGEIIGMSQAAVCRRVSKMRQKIK